MSKLPPELVSVQMSRNTQILSWLSEFSPSDGFLSPGFLGLLQRWRMSVWFMTMSCTCLGTLSKTSASSSLPCLESPPVQGQRTKLLMCAGVLHTRKSKMRPHSFGASSLSSLAGLFSPKRGWSAMRKAYLLSWGRLRRRSYRSSVASSGSSKISVVVGCLFKNLRIVSAFGRFAGSGLRTPMMRPRGPKVSEMWLKLCNEQRMAKTLLLGRIGKWTRRL
mmetsp:Transcript_64640/g.151925  ORF Transcript_64640/g.151925 Transcript_64640/m.151925 type:complete len:220 (-) Transcript_64640:407-1066(-)